VCSGDKESGDGVINQLLNPVSDSRRLGRYLAQITAICNARFLLLLLLLLQFKTAKVRSVFPIITDTQNNNSGKYFVLL
jgi:hypothetical protein